MRSRSRRPTNNAVLRQHNQHRHRPHHHHRREWRRRRRRHVVCNLQQGKLAPSAKTSCACVGASACQPVGGRETPAHMRTRVAQLGSGVQNSAHKTVGPRTLVIRRRRRLRCFRLEHLVSAILIHHAETKCWRMIHCPPASDPVGRQVCADLAIMHKHLEFNGGCRPPRSIVANGSSPRAAACLIESQRAQFNWPI